MNRLACCRRKIAAVMMSAFLVMVMAPLPSAHAFDKGAAAGSHPLESATAGGALASDSEVPAALGASSLRPQEVYASSIRSGALNGLMPEATYPYITIDDKDYRASSGVVFNDVLAWYNQKPGRQVLYSLNDKGEIDSIGLASATIASKAKSAKAKSQSTGHAVGVTGAAAQLSKNTALLWDSVKLKDYLDDSQISEMHDFITLWAAMIAVAQDKDEPFDQKVMKKILGKLGVSLNSYLGIMNTLDAEVKVKAKSKAGKDVTLNVSMDMQSYSLGSGDPYGAVGNIGFSLTGSGVSVSGAGGVYYANMKTFCNSVKGIANKAIEGAYDSVWGASANKVAGMFVGGTIGQFFAGKFSHATYSLLTAPAESCYKEVDVKCPVDVYAYDSSGDLCGSIVNDAVTFEGESVVMCVVGDEKRVFLEGDDFVLRLVGNGAGAMEYDIVEYEDEAVERTMVASDVPLSQGVSYYAAIPDAEGLDNGAHGLVDSNGRDVPLSRDTLQDADYDADPDVPVESIRFASESVTFGLDDMACWLPEVVFSPVDASNRMFHCYSSNPDVLEVDEFFGACRPKNIGTVEVGAVSEDGYHTAILTVTVVEGSTSSGGSSSGACGENVYWSLNESGYLSIYGEGAMWGYDAKSMWPKEAVRKLVVSSGVTSIGAYAFGGCTALSQAKLGSDLTTIGYRAFINCKSLASVEVPDGVTTISTDSFRGCASLSHVGLSKSWTEVTSFSTGGRGDVGNVFSGCESLKEIVLPDGMVKLPDYAFRNADCVESFIFPESLSEIGRYSFEGCSSLQSVAIPDTVDTILGGAYYGCANLAEVTIPRYWAVTDGDDYYRSYDAKGVFQGCPRLTEISISDGTLSIPEYAFKNCDNIERVHLPEGLKFIGGQAFARCSSLAEIDIPLSIKTMAGSAFNGVPAVVSSSGFDEDGVSSYEGTSFDWTRDWNYGSGWIILSTGEMYVLGSGGQAMVPRKTSGDESVKSVVIADGLTVIFDHAFDGYMGLESVMIPASVEQLGDYAFSSFGGYRDCVSLREVQIADGSKLESIGNWAFSGTAIQEIIVPDSVKEIGSGAFEDCVALEGVHISQDSQLASLGSGVFKGCVSLGSLYYPAPLEKIDCSAPALTSFTIDPDNKTYFADDGIVYDRSGNLVQAAMPPKDVVIRDGTVSILKSAFSGWPIISVKVPPSVKSIGESAFSDCAMLQSVEFADNGSLVSIGLNDYSYFDSPSQIFQGCTALEKIAIPSSVKRFNLGAPKLREITFLKGTSLTITTYGWDNIGADKASTVVYCYSTDNVANYVARLGYTVHLLDKTYLTNASISGLSSLTYTGGALKPAPTVKLGSVKLKLNRDYTLSYSANKNVGTAKVKVTGKGNYIGSKTATFKIGKAANPMAAKAVAKSVKLPKGKKALAKATAVSGAVKFAKKAAGAVTYAKVAKGSAKCLSIDKKTGKVTVAKGAKAGTYKLKATVKAAGDKNHKAKTQTLTLTVKVAKNAS